ncbi:ABC transporter permease [Thaumasiovibrio sp. DFM-14]|uniref:ABC transporter permease n=1 Tax=Thaumasiovibrio sp. DFM-14 TaxID=3384792 RepID=UPI0039A1012E
MVIKSRELSRNLYVLYTLAHLKQKANVRGTVLGYLWWFIEPLMLIALYSYVVGVIFGDSGPDRILMIAIGVTLWKWWSTSLSSATTSFKRYKGIVTQVKMPLPILPISEVFGQTYLFVFGYALLQFILLLMGYVPNVFALVITFIATIAVISSMSLALAMLNVFVRDTAFLVGFGLRMLFYITPIIYSIERVPERYHWLIDINPLAQLVDLFNRALIYPETVNIVTNFIILGGASLIFMGLLYLSKSLRTQIIRNV